MNIRIEPPQIAPLPETGMPRPYWSVMVPAYRPDMNYLRQTLESVLRRDPGPALMQIEVVDDCSPEMDVAAMVKEIAGERAGYRRNPQNLGLAGCWNACLAHSRGEVVHILHQDDLVLPGFYEAARRGFEACPEAGAVFCRHAFIDENSGPAGIVTPLERETAGVVPNFHLVLAYGQVLQCPSIIVRRKVYEEIGGFRADLKLVLDWEMWLRIACRYPVWFEPEVLAGYRMHSDSESSRLSVSGADLVEIHDFFDEIAERVPGIEPGRLEQARVQHAVSGVERAEQLFRRRELGGCARQIFWAMRLSPSRPVLSALGRFAGRVADSAKRKLVHS